MHNYQLVFERPVGMQRCLAAHDTSGHHRVFVNAGLALLSQIKLRAGCFLNAKTDTVDKQRLHDHLLSVLENGIKQELSRLYSIFQKV